MTVSGVTHVLTFNTADFERYKEVAAIHPNELTA
jgi:hypothetical protein